MKNFGHWNVSKHRGIKNVEKYITLDIYFHLGSPEKIKITYSEPNEYWGRSGEVLITSLGLKTIRISKRIKKEWFAINSVSLKYIYKIIK